MVGIGKGNQPGEDNAGTVGINVDVLPAQAGSVQAFKMTVVAHGPMRGRGMPAGK